MTHRTQSDILQGYIINDGVVRSPGKFEGEHFSTILLHDLMLNGCTDEQFDLDDTGEHFDVFLVHTWDDGEMNAMGLTIGTHAIVLSESEQGFVTAQAMNARQFAAFEASCTATIEENAELEA